MNKVGRPSKIGGFIEAFKKILTDDEFDVVILTDDELRIACNELLPPYKQVASDTFESWKAGRPQDSDEYQEFVRLYKKALSNQKRDLFKKIQGDEKAWQRFAWIIERKFSDWNLRRIGEQTTKHEGLGDIKINIISPNGD